MIVYLLEIDVCYIQYIFKDFCPFNFRCAKYVRIDEGQTNISL